MRRRERRKLAEFGRIRLDRVLWELNQVVTSLGHLHDDEAAALLRQARERVQGYRDALAAHTGQG